MSVIDIQSHPKFVPFIDESANPHIKGRVARIAIAGPCVKPIVAAKPPKFFKRHLEKKVSFNGVDPLRGVVIFQGENKIGHVIINDAGIADLWSLTSQGDDIKFLVDVHGVVVEFTNVNFGVTRSIARGDFDAEKAVANNAVEKDRQRSNGRLRRFAESFFVSFLLIASGGILGMIGRSIYLTISDKL